MKAKIQTIKQYSIMENRKPENPYDPWSVIHHVRTSAIMAHKIVWYQEIKLRSNPICSGNIKARSLGIVHHKSSYLTISCACVNNG